LNKGNGFILGLIKTLVRRSLEFFFDRVFNAFPKIGNFIHSRYLRARGQGYGTSTTTQEARLALAFFESKMSELRILDVGANVGDYTAACLEICESIQIKSFEPSPAASLILRNRFSHLSNVEVIELALGAESGMRTLYSDEPGSGMASLTKRRLDHHKIFFSEAVAVYVDTLDNWCMSQGFIPNLIKLDVEGHELEVLTGGKEILGEVEVVQFEFGGCNIDTKTYFQDFWYFFQALDFELFRVTPFGIRLIENYSEEDEYFRTTNFIAVSRRILSR
jgi:FkbM family methyltransferase